MAALQHETIVLVGSGPSLLGSNLGAVIDAFDNVVRFNEYQTQGYEQDVGSKVTHWVRNDLVPSDARTGQKETFLAVPSFKRWTRLKNPLAHCERRIPWRIQKSIRKVTGSWKKDWPSSGLLALAYFLGHYPHIHVAGFDAMTPDEFRNYHYYGDPEYCPHPPHLERAYLDSVCNQGRVTRLIDPAFPAAG